MNNDEIWLLTEKYNGEKTDGFFTDVLQLKAGVPLAYLIGNVPFLGTTIHLDSHPLIPRTETEYWVEKAITEIAKLEAPKVLDLCAGSGCIGIAVLAAIPTAQVTFAEIDPRHNSTIYRTIHTNRIDVTRTTIVNGNLFENISGTYDVILSNPPYIDKEAHTTDRDVLAYEPHLALFGGRSGIEIIEHIITKAPAHLRKHGLLYIEHEPSQSKQIAMLGTACGFTVTTALDQYGIERYSVLTRAYVPTVAE